MKLKEIEVSKGLYFALINDEIRDLIIEKDDELGKGDILKVCLRENRENNENEPQRYFFSDIQEKNELCTEDFKCLGIHDKYFIIRLEKYSPKDP